MNKKKHIVAVVDDDHRVIESLEELFESAGYAVRAFSSGEQLLSSGELEEFDCLTTDVAMPGMDGFTLQRLVSEQRPDLPVFLLTGRDELAELARKRGKKFFRKPFDGSSLLAAIAEVLVQKEKWP